MRCEQPKRDLSDAFDAGWERRPTIDSNSDACFKTARILQSGILEIYPLRRRASKRILLTSLQGFRQDELV